MYLINALGYLVILCVGVYVITEAIGYALRVLLEWISTVIIFVTLFVVALWISYSADHFVRMMKRLAPPNE